MFLTSLSTADIYEPADYTSQDKQRPPPDPLVEHPAGVFFINFSAQFTRYFSARLTRFTLQRFAASGGGYSDSPSMPSRANAVKRDTARKYFF